MFYELDKLQVLGTYSQISVSINRTKNKRNAGRTDMKGTHIGRVLGPVQEPYVPVALVTVMRFESNGFINQPLPVIVV